MDLQTAKLLNGKASFPTGLTAFLLFVLAGGLLMVSHAAPKQSRADTHHLTGPAIAKADDARQQ